VLAGLTAEGIRWALSATNTGNWHPLTWISLMADSQIYGPGPAGYHVTNLVLHVANALLVFFLFRYCPLHYTSPNAPQTRDVLGTILLSVLAGHWRYAHISALRGDGVNPELLGMTKVVSEDSVRRALSSLEEEESAAWLKQHLKASYEPLLKEPWALDVDTTVKPLYGHQEDAKVGYNPQKPGRPSHAYHSYFIANLRMVVDVEVQAGNQTAASFAQPELWSFFGQNAEVQPSGLSARRLSVGKRAGDERSRGA
jgi:hypothetical protein